MLMTQPGYTLADLEGSVDRSAIRANEGEAALYGIAYDDSAYDYMSHLKPIGASAGDSVLISGPRGSGVAKGMKGDRKGKGKADEMFDLPEDVFASEQEISLQDAYDRAEAIPSELQGLQPDMDPHLRQVLEALEDDAFVDEKGEEDWFAELVGGGEKEDNEDGDEWEFREEGVDEEQLPQGPNAGVDEDAEETWEDRFKAFKEGKQPAMSEIDPAERSEMADTIGSLATNLDDMMVVGAKKRRGKRGPSDASGMSMSSSSMFRNAGLRTLDERFDKVSDNDLTGAILIRLPRLSGTTSSTTTTTTISRSTMTTQYPSLPLIHLPCPALPFSPPRPHPHPRSRATTLTRSWMISWTIMRLSVNA